MFPPFEFAAAYCFIYLESSPWQELVLCRSMNMFFALILQQRYKVCTKRGFLNVHADPRSGPFATDNITGKLEDGQIVTSVGEPFGTCEYLGISSYCTYKLLVVTPLCDMYF